MLASLLAFSAAAALIVLLPGPDSLLVLRSVVRHGRGGATRTAAVVMDEPTGRGGVLGSGFTAGLTTNLLNPKVGVFFVTFLPAFVPAGYPVGVTSLLFGAVYVAETALYFAVLLLLVGRITTWMRNPTIRRRLDRVTGVVLVGFGVRLATES